MSPEVATDTPRRTTRVTLFSDPKCRLATARALSAARCALPRVQLPGPAPRLRARRLSLRELRWEASRSERADCVFAPLPRRYRRARAATGVGCPGLSSAAQRRLAEVLPELPFANMCSTIYV